MSLRNRTILSLAAIVAAVLVLFGTAWLHYQEQSLKQTIFHGIDGQARLAAHGIGAVLRDSLTDATAVASSIPAELLDPGREAELQAHLARMFALFPRFQNGIALLDPRGRLIADAPEYPALHGESFAFRDYYLRTLRDGRGVVATPYVSRRTQRPALSFTAPIRNAGGAVVAITVCTVDLLSPGVLGGYRDLRYGESGYLYVFDPSRLLILHPSDARLLTTVEKGANSLLETALGGFQGPGETVNSQGVGMLLAVRRVPGAEWFVGIQIPLAEAYAPIARERARFFTLSLLALALLVILTALATGRVVRPLQALEQAAREIVQGLSGTGPAASRLVTHAGLEAVRTTRPDDEIGRLAGSFHRLALELEQTLGSLHRAAAEWERTFHSVQEAVVLLDADERVLRLNRTAERWFAVPGREVRGLPARQLLFGDAAAERTWPDLGALGEDQAYRWDQELRRPPGWYELALTPVRHEGAIAGAVLVVTDVTERKRLEEAALRSSRIESLAALAGGLAHEFNNALAVILGNLSAARAKPDLSPGVEEILADAERAATNAQAVTRQLLAHAGGGTPARQRQAMAERVRSAAAQALEAVDAPGELDVAADLWPVDVDEGELREVVQNLIRAAARGRAPGAGIRLAAFNVTLGHASDREEQGEIHLCVTGGGGARALLQVPETEPELASTRSVVSRHGGILEVHVEPNRGRKVTVRLPVAWGAAEPGLASSDSRDGRLRILLMDDEQLERRDARRLLQQLGFAVTEAREGDEVLALYSEAAAAGWRFDVVILDLGVRGGFGGRETLERLRELDPAVRAVAASADAGELGASGPGADGFAAFARKPWRLDQLREALRTALAPRA